ncbi:hypothetical protein DVH05_001638 [Phytophthora capsici]|nr:hypothetical protein DVH05_001638 [Phytophthora capsici]
MKGNRGSEEALEMVAYSDAGFAADKEDRKFVRKAGKAKHIAVRIKFIGCYTRMGVLKPGYVASEDTPADLMTKAWTHRDLLSCGGNWECSRSCAAGGMMCILVDLVSFCVAHQDERKLASTSEEECWQLAVCRDTEMVCAGRSQDLD